MTRLEELLDIIPGVIEHPIIKSEWKNSELERDWSEDNYHFALRIEKRDNKFSATYVFTGFEGETQTLPMTNEEFQEVLEYGCVLQYHDLYKPTLEEALEELLCWLKNVGKI